MKEEIKYVVIFFSIRFLNHIRMVNTQIRMVNIQSLVSTSIKPIFQQG